MWNQWCQVSRRLVVLPRQASGHLENKMGVYTEAKEGYTYKLWVVTTMEKVGEGHKFGGHIPKINAYACLRCTADFQAFPAHNIQLACNAQE